MFQVVGFRGTTEVVPCYKASVRRVFRTCEVVPRYFTVFPCCGSCPGASACLQRRHFVAALTHILPLSWQQSYGLHSTFRVNLASNFSSAGRFPSHAGFSQDKEGRSQWLSTKGRSSGSITPRATDSLEEMTGPMCSYTIQRSRWTDTRRSKRVTRSSLTSSRARKVRRRTVWFETKPLWCTTRLSERAGAWFRSHRSVAHWWCALGSARCYKGRPPLPGGLQA